MLGTCPTVRGSWRSKGERERKGTKVRWGREGDGKRQGKGWKEEKGEKDLEWERKIERGLGDTIEMEYSNLVKLYLRSDARYAIMWKSCGWLKWR